MFDQALDTLADNSKPIIHSDRGAHYRWPGWIERIETNSLTQSMSKKGCSPDNSACEGFSVDLKMSSSMALNGTIFQLTHSLNYLMITCIGTITKE